MSEKLGLFGAVSITPGGMVLVGVLHRTDDFVFVVRSITVKRVSFGVVNCDDPGPKELLCLRNF
jgi:hypothetical protein